MSKKKTTIKYIGNALVVNSKKSNSSAANGDIIAVYPVKRELSAYEISSFDICKISAECFSEDEIKKLKAGQPLVYPYRTKEHTYCCVTVSKEAIQKGCISKNDLTEK